MRLKPFCIAIWIISWWLWPVHIFAQPMELSLADYDRLLRATYAAAQRGDLLELQTLAAELTAINQVRMPDGQTAHVDHRWLAEALAPSAPDTSAIAARLGALIDALPPSTAVVTDALKHWEAVLNEPPFNRDQSESWFTHFLDWLLDGLADLLPDLPDMPVTPTPGDPSWITPVAWGILAITALLFGGLIFFWARNMRRALRPVVGIAESGVEAEPVTFSQAQRMAEAAQRAGDRRNAVRYLYLAALLWLDEQKLLSFQRELTNREYLSRLRDQPPLYAQLTPIIATFEAVWYGLQTIEEQAFRAYEQQVATLIGQTGTYHEATA
jgi:hypothetical protein